MRLPATTSQTVGPFFQLGCAALYRTELAGPGVSGERVTIQGRVLDGDGLAVPDAVLEVWQADAAGEYAQRVELKQGQRRRIFWIWAHAYRRRREFFDSQRSNRVPLVAPTERDRRRTFVSVFARGLLTRLITRIYFPEDPSIESDYVVRKVEAERRGTLMAWSISNNREMREWNVNLQGKDETVFFDL